MNCYKCGALLDLPTKKIPFSAVCENCTAYLHSCKGCRHYDPAFSNSCRIQGTETIRDREAKNFCEEFQPLLTLNIKKQADHKKRFNSLFKDD